MKLVNNIDHSEAISWPEVNLNELLHADRIHKKTSINVMYLKDI